MTETSPIQQAIRHGWPLIALSAPTDSGPMPGKKPVKANWETAPGLSADDAETWLAQGGNIGVRCGDGLLVVDCDGDRPDGLPETPAVQTGGGGMHLYYRVPPGVTMRVGNTVRHIHPTTDTRGVKGQVVYPPSIHAKTGALYEWLPGMSPDDIPIADLPQWVIDAINDASPPPWKNTAPVSGKLIAAQAAAHIARGINDAYLGSALRNAAAAVQSAGEGARNNELNKQCFSLARLVELTDDDIYSVMLPAALAAGLGEHESRRTIQSGITSGRAKPQPIPTRDAPAAASPASPQPAVTAFGQPDPLYVSCPAPRALADKYLADVHPGGTLRYWRGDWYEYDGRRYAVVPEVMLKARLSATLATWHYESDKRDNVPVMTSLKEGLLRDVIGQLRQPGRTIIPDRREVPIWMDGTQRPPARDWVSLNNGLLHLGPGREFVPHTPALFCTSALPFDYDPDAPSPETWIEFLTGTWPGDDGADCALLLAEWFGYCLSRDMSLHKMMWIIGPRRSGKGLISRILEGLLGEDATCNPTLGSLGEKRGAQVLIEARLAVIGDARLGRRNDQSAIVERLLSISGGDKQTIHRVYQTDWTGRLALKFMLLSNELPTLADASGALLGRLLLLPTVHSHFGREDRFLESRIKRELPGILNWALGGLERLNAQGRFTEPAASKEILAGFRAISSPVSAFVADRCEVGVNGSTERGQLYGEYVKWAEDEGLRPYGKSKFGQALRSAFPAIGDVRVRTYGSRIRQYEGIRLVPTYEEQEAI